MKGKEIDIREIIKDWLSHHKYDGLYNLDLDCGCCLDDLFPCEGPPVDCYPGHKIKCEVSDCDWLWCMGPEDAKCLKKEGE